MSTPTTTKLIDLKDLRPGSKAPGGSINSRRTDVPLDGLVLSIKTHGLLMPLLVAKVGKEYFVAAGNRRLAALEKIHGKKSSGVQIPCIDIGSIDNDKGRVALDISLAENIDRANLHAVDRFEVVAELIARGMTIEQIAAERSMKPGEVRQALALGKLSPKVREAWRAGNINEETAEAFAITSDHKAQDAALKKTGRHGGAYQVKRMLSQTDTPIDAMLKYVGIESYEAAGHEVNKTLFSARDEVSVSDVGALKRMSDEKLAAAAEKIVKDEGWKWCILRSNAPSDLYAWRRMQPASGKYTKEQMSETGCTIGFDYDGKVKIDRGYVKPGDSVKMPKSPGEKKKAQAKRIERMEQTGGVSNALSDRLTVQMTRAFREAVGQGKMNANDIAAFTVAALTCDYSPMTLLRVEEGRVQLDDVIERDENDFDKYYAMLAKKKPSDVVFLMATVLASLIDLTRFGGGSNSVNQMLHPGKGEPSSVRLLASKIEPKAFKTAMLKHFDAEDYCNSVSKDLLVEAIGEHEGKDAATRVSKMKSAEARVYAVKALKGKWVPKSFRL